VAGKASGEMSLATLQSLLHSVDRCFLPDRPVVEVVTKEDSRELIQDTAGRLQKCRTAGAVFREFAVDAAAAKVEEMKHGKTSSARQRAQETVLEYALGKAVQRNLSMTLKVSDMGEEELTHEIRTLMGELGFAGSQGASSRLLVGAQGRERPIEALEVSTSPRSPAELCEVVRPDKTDPGGEQTGEIDDRGV